MSTRFGIGKSFADIEVERRNKKENFLDKINNLINWEEIENVLKKLNSRREKNAAGNPSYPSLLMFKILLIKQWYKLSDEKTEEYIRDSISVSRFLNLSLSVDTPDASTICRFRNLLVEESLEKKLLNTINSQLLNLNILLKEGCIVDATVVESARRPRKEESVVCVDRDEDGNVSESNSYEVKKTYSDDEDAKWLKKGKRFYYGYKIHACTDNQDGFILGGHATGANVSDTGELESVLEESDLKENIPVDADKGYSSKKNRELLETRGFKDQIMFKAQKGKPLSDEQKKINKEISSVRFIIERSFGTLKRDYLLSRAKYLGKKKLSMQFHLSAIAFNLKKAINLIKFTPKPLRS